MKNHIGVVYTQFGQIIGEFTEIENMNLNTVIGYQIENPCVIQVGNKQIVLLPLLELVTENKLILKLEDIQFKGQIFTPVDQIRNHYTSQYGGIQLITSPS